MKKKDKKIIYFIVGIVLLLIVINVNKTSPVTNYNLGEDGLNQNTQTNYYCCSSANGYSCSLNSCPSGSSKVYIDPFNTLSGCNGQCVLPQQIQPLADQSLTCAQKASQLNALYYNKEVSTAKECLDFAILDCQDVGKVIDGYGVSGTCCYFTCGAIAPQQPEPEAVVICHDSDSNLIYPTTLETLGNCHDNTKEISDSCDGAMVKEYSCDPGMNGGASSCGYGTYNCPAIIPGTTCQNGKCVATNTICDAQCDALQGYNSGACFPYNPNGAMSMAQTCVNNNGEYKSITGVCAGTAVCCCR